MVIDKFGKTCAIKKSAINSLRHDFGFEYKPSKRRQSLLIPQKTNWISFCKTILQFTEMHKIIFSDESRSTQRSDTQYIWRRRGDWDEVAFADEEKYPVSTMFWGIFKCWRVPVWLKILIHWKAQVSGFSKKMGLLAIWQNIFTIGSSNASASWQTGLQTLRIYLQLKIYVGNQESTLAFKDPF